MKPGPDRSVWPGQLLLVYPQGGNPFSESHFKTLKYQPEFPKRFGCIQDAKAFCRRFFDWYNQDYNHAGIGLMTPDQVHYGQAETQSTQRVRTRASQPRSMPRVRNSPRSRGARATN